MKPHAPQAAAPWCRHFANWSLCALLLAAALAAPPAFAQQAPPPPAARQLSLENTPWHGDFDRMLERRMIRVLVPYSRSLFFIDKGRERGITADNLRDFERFVNQKYAKQLGKRPLTVYLIATTRDKLFTQLNAGLGDIAAGNLTVTEERLKLVDFVAPKDKRSPVRELLATGPKAPGIRTLDELAGKTVHVRPATSYAESLAALNQRLQAAGKPPARLALLPDALEDEDILEMLNAGLLDFVVVDDWKGEMWAQVLPKIRLHEDLVLRSEAYTGWAIRKGSPLLAAEILDAYHHLTKQGVLAYRMAQYHKRVKQIADNSDDEELGRFENTVALFQTYGDKYRFDPLMLAAQGYQESRLRQDAQAARRAAREQVAPVKE